MIAIVICYHYFSDSLPIFDLICLLAVNFLQKCVSSDSDFTAYFMDVLSHRLGVTPYFVVNGIM